MRKGYAGQLAVKRRLESLGNIVIRAHTQGKFGAEDQFGCDLVALKKVGCDMAEDAVFTAKFIQVKETRGGTYYWKSDIEKWKGLYKLRIEKGVNSQFAIVFRRRPKNAIYFRDVDIEVPSSVKVVCVGRGKETRVEEK